MCTQKLKYRCYLLHEVISQINYIGTLYLSIKSNCSNKVAPDCLYKVYDV